MSNARIMVGDGLMESTLRNDMIDLATQIKDITSYKNGICND